MNKKQRSFAVVGAVAVSAARPPAARTMTRRRSRAAQTVLDKSPKIVAYQLKRLTNKQLVDVETQGRGPKYSPVYKAILTRKGMEKKFSEESVDAIAKGDKTDAVTVLVGAIPKVDADDKATLRELASLLMAQKPAAGGAEGKAESLAKESESPTVKQGRVCGAGDGGRQCRRRVAAPRRETTTRRRCSAASR